MIETFSTKSFSSFYGLFIGIIDRQTNKDRKGPFYFMMIDAGKFITKGQWPFVFRFVVVVLFKKAPNLRMV